MIHANLKMGDNVTLNASDMFCYLCGAEVALVEVKAEYVGKAIVGDVQDVMLFKFTPMFMCPHCLGSQEYLGIVDNEALNITVTLEGI